MPIRTDTVRTPDLSTKVIHKIPRIFLNPQFSGKSEQNPLRTTLYIEGVCFFVLPAWR